jgi:hypothetical protein
MSRDPDLAVVAHEAAHCVAAYILGIPIEKVEVWGSSGLVRTGGRATERLFDFALVQLAGGAYLRSIGLQADGDDNDFERAVAVVEMAVDRRGEAAWEAFAVVAEATHALVASDRFQLLVARLTPKLASGSWHYGGDVLRFLGANDPERETQERHSAEPRSGPWYVVHDRTSGRVLYDGISYQEAHEIQVRTGRHAMLVGSAY